MFNFIHRTGTLAVALTAGLIGSAALPAAANVVTNGDFESMPFDQGWTNSDDAAIATTGLDGSGTAAYIQAGSSGVLEQTGLAGLSTPTGNHWRIRVQFATTSSGDAGQRSFNMQVTFPGASGSIPTINLRVIPASDTSTAGTIQAYSTHWNSIFSNVVQWTADANGDKDFADAGDTLNVYNLILDGDSTTGTYNVSLSGAGITGALTADGVNYFQHASPDTTQGSVAGVTFSAAMAQSDFAIDNVGVSAVPEPGSLALLGLGAVMVLSRKRRGTNAQ